MTEYLDKRNIFPIYLTIGITIIIFSVVEIIFRNSFNFYLNIPLTLMCLIYWNMALPKSVGLFWAIISGFVLDLSQDLVLGSNVMIFLISSYLIQRYFHRLRALSNFSSKIFLELLIFTLISAFIWPIIYGLLRNIRIKFTYGS